MQLCFYNIKCVYVANLAATKGRLGSKSIYTRFDINWTIRSIVGNKSCHSEGEERKCLCQCPGATSWSVCRPGSRTPGQISCSTPRRLSAAVPGTCLQRRIFNTLFQDYLKFFISVYTVPVMKPPRNSFFVVSSFILSSTFARYRHTSTVLDLGALGTLKSSKHCKKPHLHTDIPAYVDGPCFTSRSAVWSNHRVPIPPLPPHLSAAKAGRNHLNE